MQLLTSGNIFPPGTDQATIRGAIYGQLPMPWEDVLPSQRSPLQASVVSCFARDPAKRPAAAALAASWRRLASSTAGAIEAALGDETTDASASMMQETVSELPEVM